VPNDAQRRLVDELVRDLDLIVYRLELPAAPTQDPADLRTRQDEERRRLRRELEDIRDRLTEVADSL